MTRDAREWKGCFTAVITPFKENGELDKEAFCENIELLISEGVHGVIIAGCTGESWALSDEERREIFSECFWRETSTERWKTLSGRII